MVLKAPPLSPVSTWTGFYFGLEVGGAVSRSTVIHGPNDPFIATGITSGYNYQVGQFVFGYEGDVSFASLSGTGNLLAPNFNTANSRTVNVDNVSTFRGRVGWLVTPRWLIFATGGAALAGEQFTWTSPGPPLTQQNADQYAWGYAVGAGVEWKIERISLKVEYLHIGLNQIEFDNTQMVGGPGFFSTDNLVRPNIDIVRAGVNVKLDSLPAFLPSFLPMN
jgi:outer membrane immunogenic protein